MMIDSLMSPVLDWFVCFIIKEKKKKLLTMEQNQMLLIEAFFFFQTETLLSRPVVLFSCISTH